MFLTGYVMLLYYIYSFSFTSVMMDDKKEQIIVILPLAFLLEQLSILLDDCLKEKGKMPSFHCLNHGSVRKPLSIKLALLVSQAVITQEGTIPYFMAVLKVVMIECHLLKHAAIAAWKILQKQKKVDLGAAFT